MVFRALIFIFLFRTNSRKEHLDEKDFRHGYSNYFESAILKVFWLQLCSNFFLNNYEAHWLGHLKDILQLKVLETWINKHANFFLSTCETKIDKGARKFISSTKIRAYSLKKTAPKHSIYYYILFLSKKPSF